MHERSKPISTIEPPASLPGPLVSRYLEAVPGVIACAVVDLSTGTFLALETSGNHPTDFLAYLATTTRNYFQGDAVRTISAVLDEATQSQHPARQIDEITLRSTSFLHAMVRLADRPSAAVVLVTLRETKLGLVLSAAHSIANDPEVGRTYSG